MAVESLSKMPSDIILHIFEQADTRDIQSLAEVRHGLLLLNKIC